MRFFIDNGFLIYYFKFQRQDYIYFIFIKQRLINLVEKKEVALPFSHYCKNNFLNNKHQIKSIQPRMMPTPKMTIIAKIKRNKPPLERKADHLTIISVIQLTPGIKSKMIWIKRGKRINALSI